MKIVDVIKQRSISEVVHFTTNHGLLGALSTGTLISRQRLPNEKLLEHILTLNCTIRRDVAWLDYVNLSISRINNNLFTVSSTRWHRDKDLWWCILAFSPEIMAHDGVYFASTNNMYTGVTRAPGGEGLEALFSSSIRQYNENYVHRNSIILAHHTTCRQAEVLYPGELSMQFLRRIYVATPDHSDIVHAIYVALGLTPVDIVVSPEVFLGTP